MKSIKKNIRSIVAAVITTLMLASMAFSFSSCFCRPLLYDDYYYGSSYHAPHHHHHHSGGHHHHHSHRGY